MTLSILLIAHAIITLVLGIMISSAAALIHRETEALGVGLIITIMYLILGSGLLSLCWGIGSVFV